MFKINKNNVDTFKCLWYNEYIIKTQLLNVYGIINIQSKYNIFIKGGWLSGQKQWVVTPPSSEYRGSNPLLPIGLVS